MNISDPTCEEGQGKMAYQRTGKPACEAFARKIAHIKKYYDANYGGMPRVQVWTFMRCR